MTRTVSVVIPTYNQAKYLPQAISSALEQTHAPLEVIVVNDGSTDNTKDVLEAFEHPRRELLRIVHQKNAGVAAARNTGLKEARGDLLAFLDSDDYWLPQKLEKQVACFEARPHLGLVHCGVLDVNASGEPIVEHLDGMEGRVGSEMLFFRRAVILGGGSAAMVTREAAEAIGEFDVRMPPAEDWDFYRRVGSRFDVGFVPEILVHYRIHGANGHLNIRRMEKSLLIGYDKAFREADAQLLRQRRRAYGNLHMMLAGSYFVTKQPTRFARQALLSLCYTPGNGVQLLGYPMRKLRRKRQKASA